MAGWNGYDHRLCRCYSGGIHDPQREWEREEGLRESLRSFYCGEVDWVKAMHTWRAVRDGKAGLVHAAAASNLTVRFVKVPPQGQEEAYQAGKRRRWLRPMRRMPVAVESKGRSN